MLRSKLTHINKNDPRTQLVKHQTINCELLFKINFVFYVCVWRQNNRRRQDIDDIILIFIQLYGATFWLLNGAVTNRSFPHELLYMPHVEQLSLPERLKSLHIRAWIYKYIP